MTMTTPGIRKKTMATVVSQTISPAVVGQTRVQICISYLQKMKKESNTVPSFSVQNCPYLPLCLWKKMAKPRLNQDCENFLLRQSSQVIYYLRVLKAHTIRNRYVHNWNTPINFISNGNGNFKIET